MMIIGIIAALFGLALFGGRREPRREWRDGRYKEEQPQARRPARGGGDSLRSASEQGRAA